MCQALCGHWGHQSEEHPALSHWGHRSLVCPVNTSHQFIPQLILLSTSIGHPGRGRWSSWNSVQMQWGPGEAIQDGFQEEDILKPRACQDLCVCCPLCLRGASGRSCFGFNAGRSSLACSDTPSCPTPLSSPPLLCFILTLVSVCLLITVPPSPGQDKVCLVRGSHPWQGAWHIAGAG